MMLKSFGCSFIFGTDLPDDGRGKQYATPSNLTWPALVARHLNHDYVCYARPGSGNLRILEQILTQANNIEKSTYVVGWSWIDRFDYNDPVNDSWKTIMPPDETALAHTYYRDLHSQHRDKLSTLIYIKTAIDTLKQKNCQFIMTYIDDLIFETKWHITPAISDLQEYVRPHLTKFEDLNFLDFSRKYNFPISSTMHPLEQAHQAAAQCIINQSLV
jgi:hypothetical protein